jgi:hypothetical protein
MTMSSTDGSTDYKMSVSLSSSDADGAHAVVSAVRDDAGALTVSVTGKGFPQDQDGVREMASMLRDVSSAILSMLGYEEDQVQQAPVQAPQMPMPERRVSLFDPQPGMYSPVGHSLPSLGQRIKSVSNG